MTEEQLKAIREAAERFALSELDDAHADVLALLDEIESLRKDAERYRRLASNPYHDGYAWWTQDICILESDNSNLLPTKEQVDAAMDGFK